jgi:hypothetical protein
MLKVYKPPDRKAYYLALREDGNTIRLMAVDADGNDVSNGSILSIEPDDNGDYFISGHCHVNPELGFTLEPKTGRIVVK